MVYQLDYTIFFLPTAHRKNNLNDTQVTSLNHTSTQTSPRGVVDIASGWNVLVDELCADRAQENGREDEEDPRATEGEEAQRKVPWRVVIHDLVHVRGGG